MKNGQKNFYLRIINSTCFSLLNFYQKSGIIFIYMFLIFLYKLGY
jgi:hypothetical protein